MLSSNAGTISKFNRLGVRAGFGDRLVSLRRMGGRHVPGDDALDAQPFDEDVEAIASEEGWSDELAMYHNPNAVIPADEAMFPGVAHYHVVNGEAFWFGPPYRVLYSSTATFDLLGRDKAMMDLLPDDKIGPKEGPG